MIQAAADAAIAKSQPAKLLALDLDGTIWPGVLLEGSPPPPCAGSAQAELAAIAVRLQERGVLLCSVSRNDEAPVLAAWPADCAVQPRHFVLHLFGWGPKSERVAEIAARGGAAHASIVFIDNCAHERSEVAEALPHVRVLDPVAAQSALLDVPCLAVAEADITPTAK
eukprot:gene4280-4567_t